MDPDSLEEVLKYLLNVIFDCTPRHQENYITLGKYIDNTPINGRVINMDESSYNQQSCRVVHKEQSTAQRQ